MEETPLCCQRQMRGSEKDSGEQSAWRSPSSVDNDWYSTGDSVPEELCFPLCQPGERCKALAWVFLLLLCYNKFVSLQDAHTFLKCCSFHHLFKRGFLKG